MFDPKELSYPRVEDGVVLHGPEDWPPAKLAALQRIHASENGVDSTEDQWLNLNTATAEELMEGLPRVGESLAEAIIEARPFESVDDLAKVKGITKSAVDKVRDRLAV
jgi:competence ComEA-like helix-hairpin-helix protein